jgi:hypothetical protein
MLIAFSSNSVNKFWIPVSLKVSFVTLLHLIYPIDQPKWGSNLCTVWECVVLSLYVAYTRLTPCYGVLFGQVIKKLVTLLNTFCHLVFVGYDSSIRWKYKTCFVGSISWNWPQSLDWGSWDHSQLLKERFSLTEMRQWKVIGVCVS